MKTFTEDLNDTVNYHGHICAGQIIGVRMARCGLNLLNIEDPKKYRDLIVLVETDRCLADAIGTVTDCKIGKRRLKIYDFGKSAAVFYDINTKKAYRLYKKYSKFAEKGEDIVEFFNKVSDNELFDVQEVEVKFEPWDLPGKPLIVEVCDECGEEILDGRHIKKEESIICKSCMGEKYYE